MKVASYLRIALLVMILVAGFSVVLGSDDNVEEARRLANLLAMPMPERGAKWQCTPTKRYDCSFGGCTANKPSVWLLLDFRENTYARCDDKGCDKYNMVPSASGIYTVISLLAAGSFMKVENDGRTYVEVASLGPSVVTNFGSCSPVVQ